MAHPMPMKRLNKERNEQMMTTAVPQISRKPHQGLCICDDCDRRMKWDGIEWSIMNNRYLLCSSCACRWFKENRYRVDERTEPAAFRMYPYRSPSDAESSIHMSA